jgi:diguanylate cyclase (GGDEF)-like protein
LPSSLFTQEFGPQVGGIRQSFEQFRSAPEKNWDALTNVRGFFHRIAGVARPLGMPMLGVLAANTEDLIVLLGSGKAQVNPTSLGMLASSLSAVESVLAQPSSAEAPTGLPQPTAAVSRVPGAERQKVFIVDDDPLSTRLIELSLHEAGFTTVTCKNGKETLGILEEERPDLILLDLLMPDQDGFETCRQIRATAQLDRIPIIFLTRINALEEKVQALRSGGDDYITKPFEPTELVARVSAHIQRYTAQRDQAIRDPLTGVFNPRYFRQAFNRAIRAAQQDKQPLCVAMIDVDRFKEVNDEYGHQAGDKVLTAVASRIGGTLRKSDLLARYGGDEFAAIFTKTAAYGVLSTLERLIVTVRQMKVPIGDNKMASVSLSIGLAGWTPGESAEDLHKRADAALYEAKERGRNRLVVAESRAKRDSGVVPFERAPRPPTTTSTTTSKGPLRILLVDDSSLTRDVLKMYLMKLDVILSDANNGKEALAKVRSERPSLVLADLRMPEVDGLELSRTLRDDPSTAHIPVIILTAYLEPTDYERCMASGAKEVLTKPVEPLQLLNAINRHTSR